MKGSVFIAASLDGFIARENGDIEWLHGTPREDGTPPPDEDHGYGDFIATVDAIVMGRGTYEKVLTFGLWPFELPVFVLTSRPETLPAPPEGAKMEALSGSPSEVASALEGRGFRHLYLDGGVTIQRFVEAGLVHRLVLTRIPVLLGRGIPLFGSTSRDIHLRHVATRSFPSGLVQSEYEVVR